MGGDYDIKVGGLDTKRAAAASDASDESDSTTVGGDDNGVDEDVDEDKS